jgi:hypothetical protein
MACNGKCACGGVTHNVSIQPGFVDYCVVRGDAFADTVTIKEPPTPGADPEPVDLTSPARTYAAQLRTSANSPDIVATFAIDMSDAVNGTFGFSLPSSTTEDLTGSFVYDIQQTISPSSSPRTILAGVFTFTPDVTR